MEFIDYFKTLCCTCGSSELHLVSGLPEELKSVKLTKIINRMSLALTFNGFWGNFSDLLASSGKIQNLDELATSLAQLEDPQGKIKELIELLDSKYYDTSKLLDIVKPFLAYSEAYKTIDVEQMVAEIKQQSNRQSFFLGYFIFFDLADGRINILSSRDVVAARKKIMFSETKFCIANLRSSVAGQDRFIAEGFCTGFNTMLTRNGFRPLMIEQIF